MLFVQLDDSFSPSLFDVLRQAHVHTLKYEVESTVIIFYPFCLHNVWAMRSFVLVKTLQNLNFSLLESLLFCRVFVLELFDGIGLAIFDISTFVNMAKTTRANKLSNLILSP